jgi:hypothetical protein
MWSSFRLAELAGNLPNRPESPMRELFRACTWPHVSGEHQENRWWKMSDPYFAAIQEQWSNIRRLYMTYENDKPIILYDIEEKKIYAYPYKEFKEDLSKNSQASLERDYKSSSVSGSMVVFVRDNAERKLVSYVMSIDPMSIQ